MKENFPMSKHKRLSILLSAVMALGFLGGILFISSLGSTPKSSEEQTPINSQAPVISSQGKELLKQFSAAFEAAAAKVNPSVVPIFSEQVTTVENPFGSPDDPFRQFFGDDFFKRFFGLPPSGEQKETIHALGSGVIVSGDGYILTNNHVVKGADKLTVILHDKKKYTAKVVGTDPQTDVAVIKISAKGLPEASLGNSDEVRVGQWVIAVGNPFQLMHTVTAGIISAKGRSSVNLADYEDFIQTDASINPGNSGGALADLDGNVIGINTAILSPSGGGNVGIGFAIPINMAKSVMNELIAKGKVTRGFVGIVLQDVDENLAKALKLKTTEGALVGDVTPGAPGDKAGIKRGDIITKFDGTKIENTEQLRNLVAEREPGTSVNITLIRDGKEMQVTVVLGERPADLASSLQRNTKPEERTSKKLGLSIQTLTESLAKQFGYQNDHGVVVTDVTAGSPAEEAGIQRGDLIKEVDRAEIRAVPDFNRATEHLRSGDSVAFLLRRGQNTFFTAVQIP
jgi:serine protease Do